MRSVKIMVDCRSVGNPTAATIDQIARLKLSAKRCDRELELKNTSPYLLELIGFAGLSEVLLVESKREPEQRKEPCGIKEEGELGDPSSR
jgi:hypothetical protein